MTIQTEIPALSQLEAITYLDSDGKIPERYQGKIGVYAIFDQQQVLQFVGYSRDVYLSLQQHLVRQPDRCYWLKVKTVERPSRTLLESIRQAWIEENGAVPAGNGSEKAAWQQPIDAKPTMTEAEKAQYKTSDELGKIKLFKKIARRVEAEIVQALAARGVQMEIRFNPKLKEQGLLDVAPAKR